MARFFGFTQTISGKMDAWSNDELFTQYSRRIWKTVRKFSDNFTLWPELTDKGRIHWHAFGTIHDKIAYNLNAGKGYGGSTRMVKRTWGNQHCFTFEEGSTAHVKWSKYHIQDQEGKHGYYINKYDIPIIMDHTFKPAMFTRRLNKAKQRVNTRCIISDVAKQGSPCILKSTSSNFTISFND